MVCYFHDEKNKEEIAPKYIYFYSSFHQLDKSIKECRLSTTLYTYNILLRTLNAARKPKPKPSELSRLATVSSTTPDQQALRAVDVAQVNVVCSSLEHLAS